MPRLFSKNNIIFAGIAIVILILGLSALFTGYRTPTSELPSEFDEGGDSVGVEGWKEFNYPGISFQAPKTMSRVYISALDWPPNATVSPGPMQCVEAGEETSDKGKTELRTIEDVRYCVTTHVEGAAGNIYKQYVYQFEKEGKVVTFTTSTREIQCVNYEGDQRFECEEERAAFELDALIHRIQSTVKLQDVE